MNDYAIAASMAQRRLTKAAQSLLGICAGLTADGTLNDQEIAFLATWIEQNNEVTTVWPGSAIAKRLDAILADGVITTEERAELISLMQDLSGNEFAETGSASPAAPAVPYDEAEIDFEGRSFCLTGNFCYGTRAACEALIETLGGTPLNSVTGKLDYLVVGTGCSDDWANTTYGRKIETALQRRPRYGKPLIIRESIWITAADNLRAATKS